MKDFEFQSLTDDEKKILLSTFGYNVDQEGFIVDTLLQERVISKITRQPLTLSNAALMPGSLRIIDSDPLSVSTYLREELEHGNRKSY